MVEGWLKDDGRMVVMIMVGVVVRMKVMVARIVVSIVILMVLRWND